MMAFFKINNIKECAWKCLIRNKQLMTENKQADFHIIAMLDQKTSKIYPGHKHEKRDLCSNEAEERYMYNRPMFRWVVVVVVVAVIYSEYNN